MSRKSLKISPADLEQMKSKLPAGVILDPGPRGWIDRTIDVENVRVPVTFARGHEEFLEQIRSTLERKLPFPAIEMWSRIARGDDADLQRFFIDLAQKHDLKVEEVGKYYMEILSGLGSIALTPRGQTVVQPSWGILVRKALPSTLAAAVKAMYSRIQFKKLNPKCVSEDVALVEKHFPHREGRAQYLIEQNYIWLNRSSHPDFTQFTDRWRIPPGLVSDPNLTLRTLIGGPDGGFPPLHQYCCAVFRALRKVKWHEGPKFFFLIDSRQPRALLRSELDRLLEDAATEPKQGKWNCRRVAAAGRLRSRKVLDYEIPVWADVRYAKRQVLDSVIKIIGPISNRPDASTRERHVDDGVLIQAYLKYRAGLSLEEIGRLQEGGESPTALKHRGMALVKSAFGRIFDRPFESRAFELLPTESELRAAGFSGLKDPRIYELARKVRHWIEVADRPRATLATRLVNITESGPQIE